ncbi:MAG TPA: hypothetical protein PK129_17165, partial [Cellvibrionaceae bacterium]|nr:hypothetical protein [Cellvibrionaceae bacterium]
PNVTMNGGQVTDFSEQGPLTQRTIRQCADFEIKDGSTAILGFHDHPDQMWINENYRVFAEECARRGWLRIEGPAA